MRQLCKLSDLAGYSLQARDGEIGKLRLIYFDDRHWTVRYFVVHTGSWLLGKDTLIAPRAVGGVDEQNRRLEVDLTREQISNAPPVDSELPVSRHYEQEYYRYYGWEPYWSGDPLFAPEPVTRQPAAATPEPQQPEHPHLRSSGEVKGYDLHASDGEIGHVEDFILEHPGWAVRYLEIDTGKWLPGKKVLIAPAWIQQVDWARKEVAVDLTREVVQTAPAHDASRVISRDYEIALYKHYGKTLEN